MTSEKIDASPSIGPLDPSAEAALTEPDTVPNDPASELPFQGPEGIEKSLPGQVVGGRYRIGRLLGTGGFGSVFEAEHVTTGQRLVVKVLRGEMALEPVQVKRFFNEAKTTCQLTHPHTVSVFDFGRTEQGLLYMAMEYLDGQELAVVLRDEAPLEAMRVVRLACAILKSLAEAHAAGLVHRDLKPGNIFLCNVHGERDFVKLIDFGIAKSYDDGETEDLTKTGFAVGTPKYMSPEQGRAEPLDGRSDIYSLGVIMYEALTGSVPFKANSAMGLIVKHMQEIPAPVAERANQELDPELAAAVMKALEKAPWDRFADADDMRATLESVLERAGMPVPPTTRAVSARMRAVDAALGASTVPGTPKRGRRATAEGVHGDETVAVNGSQGAGPGAPGGEKGTEQTLMDNRTPPPIAAPELAALDQSTGLETRIQRGLNQSSIVPSTPSRPSRNRSKYSSPERRSRGGGILLPIIGLAVVAAAGWVLYTASQGKDAATEFKRGMNELAASAGTKLREPTAAAPGQREVEKPRLAKGSERKPKYDQIKAERFEGVGGKGEPLSTKEIDAQGRRLEDRIKGCFRRHAPAGNYLKVEIDIKVGPDGRIDDATLRDKLDSDKLATCSAEAVRKHAKFRGDRKDQETHTVVVHVGPIRRAASRPAPSGSGPNGDAPL